MEILKKRCLAFLNKCRYPIEFIVFIILSIQLFKFITIKSYQGYWSKNILIGIILLGLLAVFILIYNCIKDKKNIEKIFLNFAIPIGIFFITFMLPTYTPDACSHIWKSYEVSEGIFFTKIDENGESKTKVPEALSIYRENILTKYNILEEAMQNDASYDYDKKVQEDSPSKEYCFVFYIGYAIGFFIARIIGLNLFYAIYLAKIVNFIFFLILAYWSIKKIPFGKILLSTYLMIPMMMQQATAVSVDSIMNAIIILFISYTLNLTFKKSPLIAKEKIIYFMLTSLMGIVKAPYIPIIALGFLIVKRRKDITNKEKIIMAILTIIICLGSYFAISQINSGYITEFHKSYLEENGVNSKEQINSIISNPFNYLKILLNNFIVNGDYYIYSSIGDYMGWLSIRAPAHYSIMYILLLIISIFVENNEDTLKISEKVGVIALTIIMGILVVTGLYIEWTRVGENIVAGVQGRYFLPISILGMLALCLKKNYIKIKNINIIIPLCSFLINLLFIRNMILFFR